MTCTVSHFCCILIFMVSRISWTTY